ncbi:hypothetical protein D3C71_2070620 [compost metagenome]
MRRYACRRLEGVAEMGLRQVGEFCQFLQPYRPQAMFANVIGRRPQLPGGQLAAFFDRLPLHLEEIRQ